MPAIRLQHVRAIEKETSNLSPQLKKAPTEGNVLIATLGTMGSTGVVSSISQTGVTWQATPVVTYPAGTGWTKCYIYYGIVGANASNQITVSFTNNFCAAILNVCEYSGLDTSDLVDKTATASGSGAQTSTGTTSTTTQARELWIGNTVMTGNQWNPENDFILIDGHQEYPGYSLSSTYLEKQAIESGEANSGTTQASGGWIGCIATFKLDSDVTFELGNADLLTGAVGKNIVECEGATGELYSSGSKQTVIYSTADPIIQVDSNFNDPEKSALIENLVIIGNGDNTAISLEDVNSCKIRNVTIKNCAEGIKLTSTSGNDCQSNNIEHVRMENVENGIVFDKNTGTGDFSYTHISDVGIQISDETNSKGIVVGEGSKLYSTYIKANVWMSNNSSNGIGMHITNEDENSTEIKYGLTNLYVVKEGTEGGTGVFFTNSAANNSPITDNQDLKTNSGTNRGFFLVANNLSNATEDEPAGTEITEIDF